jgi:hypothetical protein
VAGVFTQEYEDGWHPVAYYSEVMQSAELNYFIQDKKLLVIVRALDHWRSELIDLQHPEFFEIISDHEALECFATKRFLSARQARWAEKLSQYHFVIAFRPGAQNVVADSLSRKTENHKTYQARKIAQRTIQIFRSINDAHLRIEESLVAMKHTDMKSEYELIEKILEVNKSDKKLDSMRILVAQRQNE